MKQININQDETFHYEKLYSQLEKNDSGHISIAVAKKYFLKSGLSIEDINKVSEYSGANRLNYFGRSQFYVALKIIGLVQAGNKLEKDIIHSNIEYAVPNLKYEVTEKDLTSIDQKKDLPQKSPKRLHGRALSGTINLEKLHESIVNNRYRNKLHSFTSSSVTSQSDPFFIQANINFDENSQNFTENDLIDNVESSDEDNKGLLDPNMKLNIRDIMDRQFDGNSESSSNDDIKRCDKNDYNNSVNEDSDNSSGSDEDDDDDYELKNDDVDNDAKGYMLMEPVEGLAASPEESIEQTIPTATVDQLEHYTKCFQTLQFDSETPQVCGIDVINFLKMYRFDEERFNQLLKLVNINPEVSVNLIEFSKAIHLLTHVKRGFPLPYQLPPNLLPIQFEKPDEPFSFDLSTGEHFEGIVQSLDNIHDNELSPDLKINQFSLFDQMENSFSGDGDNNDFDTTDIGMNRSWSNFKGRLHSHSIPNKNFSNSFNMSTSGDKTNKDEEIVSRPRPAPKKSLSLPQSAVAPPPPPRTSTVVPTSSTNSTIKRLSSIEVEIVGPVGDPVSSSSSPSSKHEPKDTVDHAIVNTDQLILLHDEKEDSDGNETNESDIDEEDGRCILNESQNKSLNNDTINSNRNFESRRKLLLGNIRELKSRNHVLLRLNNELTNELEELREQRLNLATQLDYMRQSQFDIT